MPGRLLVGVAQADEHTEARRTLLDLLGGLDDLGVRPQVALLRDGPVRTRLEAVGDVRLLRDPPPRSPGALAEGAARRIHPRASTAVRTARTASRRRWIDDPDVIHLNGPQAVSLLRLVDGRAATVTTYVHPSDLGVDELSPVDRDLLLACTDRFLAADDGTVEALAQVPGLDPGRVVVAPRPLVFPARRLSHTERAARRRSLGLPVDGVVVGVPPVPDWAAAPDLTIATAWELQRHASIDPTHLLWCGGPADDAGRWPIEADVRRSGLTGVHLADPTLSIVDALAVADLVVLPSRTSEPVDHRFVKEAQAHGVPVLCWAGDAVSDRVGTWTGEVVDPPDVAAMAARLVALISDPQRRRELAESGRAALLAEIDQFVPSGSGR